jgi:hypothetical protein
MSDTPADPIDQAVKSFAPDFAYPKVLTAAETAIIP